MLSNISITGRKPFSKTNSQAKLKLTEFYRKQFDEAIGQSVQNNKRNPKFGHDKKYVMKSLVRGANFNSSDIIRFLEHYSFIMQNSRFLHGQNGRIKHVFKNMCPYRQTQHLFNFVHFFRHM